MSKELDKIRRKISGIDSDIVRLIARRQSYMPKVAAIKKKDGLPILQPGREKRLIASKTALAKMYAVAIQPAAETVMPKSSMILGRAKLTMV